MSYKTDLFEELCEERGILFFKGKEENNQANYKYVKNEEGAVLKSVTFDVYGMEEEGPKLLQRFFEMVEELKSGLKNNNDDFSFSYGEYDIILNSISDIVSDMISLNVQQNIIDSGDPWDEVDHVFD